MAPLPTSSRKIPPRPIRAAVLFATSDGRSPPSAAAFSFRGEFTCFWFGSSGVSQVLPSRGGSLIGGGVLTAGGDLIEGAGTAGVGAGLGLFALGGLGGLGGGGAGAGLGVGLGAGLWLGVGCGCGCWAGASGCG